MRTGIAGRQFIIATLITMLITSISWPAVADEQSSHDIEDPVPVEVDPSIHAVWDMTDGPVARGEASRAWIFGPEPIAAAQEYYPESPTRLREMVYYDKGRLDLLNTDLPPGSIWLVSGALLVSEMLSGHVQLGENAFVRRELPEIPLVGDIEQSAPVTYADLAPVSSLANATLIELEEEEAQDSTSSELLDDGVARTLQTDAPRFFSRVGEQVTELLTAEGDVVAGAVTDYSVTYDTYDETLGHNVASVFSRWAENLPMPALNLLGLPVTEPYWIQTEVDDEPTLVLVQGFERRMLTYTPSNPEGWRVESGNVGLHYRLWRDLERPERPEFAALAQDVSFGEELLAAAEENYIDPYMLVAVSEHVSGGNPFAEFVNGGVGLLGARPDRHLMGEDPDADIFDPDLNTEVGAAQFAREMYSAWDWPTILARYYANGNANGEDPERQAWVESVLTTYDELLQTYPPTEPLPEPSRQHGELIGEGRVAYYSAGYDTAWWEEAMRKHASWGNAVEGWEPDPNGYYCVHPDYYVGELMRVEANGLVIVCTIGDRVAGPHHTSWRAKWALEMNWDAFKTLSLDTNNHAKVYYLGEREVGDDPDQGAESDEPAATPTPGP